MIDAQRGTWAVLDIVREDRSPDAALLHDELVALVERSVADARIGPPTLSGASALRVVLCFAQRPADHVRVDAFLDALATSLDRRNSGLDLSEWLQVITAVDTAASPPDRIGASPLSARVLSTARTASLVIEASEVWYNAATPPDAAYRHVRSQGETFWVRIPGRSTVPGLAPVDLVLERRFANPAPRGRNRTPRGAHTVISTVHGDHHGDNVATKIVLTGPAGTGPEGNGTLDEDRGMVEKAGGMRLDGRQTGLRDALVEAYPSFDELAMLLREQLGRNLHRIASAHLRLDLVVGQAIQRAEAEGWITELVTAAFLGNPGNPALRRLIETGFCDEAFALLAAIKDPTGPTTRLWPQARMLADIVADDSGDAVRPWSGTVLERIFRRTSAFQDVRPFTSRLLAVAGQVCQIRIGPDPVGTGFLVGSDLVLTNHHVVEDVIRGRVPPTAVRCVFDFSVGDDGTIDEGVPFGLHPGSGWLVATSPPSEVDKQADPTRAPTVDELDHALLRIAEPAGLTTSLDGRERGWLRLLGPTPALALGLPLLIVQHPHGGPVKLAMADAGVETVNENRTRLTYCVNTETGSSGSPCLTFDLELVALHHSGRAFHNEGIPAATIGTHLSNAGLAALRGS